MKLRIMTLRYDPSTGYFDDAPLRRFIAPLRWFIESGAEAIEVRDHFFEHDGHPVWVLLVSYRSMSDIAPMVLRGDGSHRPDAKQELSADEGMRFEAVRAWCNARASRDGKPPYILLTNRQLAAVAKRNPNSLAALGEIPGIGEGKIQDFGAELLEILLASESSGIRVTDTSTAKVASDNKAETPHASP